MTGYDWWDTNEDGWLDGAEMDRWQLDHGGYPGQFENAEPPARGGSGDDDDGGDGRPREGRSGRPGARGGGGFCLRSYGIDDDAADGRTPDGPDHCTRCLFWTRGNGPALRERGCGIWGYVALESGDEGYDDNIERGSRHASCEFFEDDIRPRPNCCDCGNWAARSKSATVSYGCRIWRKVERLEEETDYEFSVPDSPGNAVPALCPYFS